MNELTWYLPCIAVYCHMLQRMIYIVWHLASYSIGVKATKAPSASNSPAGARNWPARLCTLNRVEPFFHSTSKEITYMLCIYNIYIYIYINICLLLAISISSCQHNLCINCVSYQLSTIQYHRCSRKPWSKLYLAMHTLQRSRPAMARRIFSLGLLIAGGLGMHTPMSPIT